MNSFDEFQSQVWNHLKRQFDQDPEFVEELESLIHFYGRKFLLKASDQEQRNLIESKLPELVKSQFFQGFYIMRSILLDEETHLPEDVWTSPLGIVRNEIPLLFDSIFKNNNDWIQTEMGQTIGMQLIQGFDGVYDLIQQMRRDISLFGAYKAFIEDSRYKPNTSPEKLLLGEPFDLCFLNPQVYMKTQFLTSEQEIWDLYFWSSMNHSEGWVGSLQLSKIPLDGQEMYLLQFLAGESLILDEVYEILNKVIGQLPSQVKGMLQTRLCHVKEMNVLIPN
ncbi:MULTISPECIES: hypothetical protein [Bacillus]|uniref:hypothetical protein n=1 Tax=Bacillus TaxID=1386 RepID=UPI00273D08AC|nr:hypothetical protein [Bacillus sp. MMSF_3328]